MSTTEEWRPIDGYPGYFISSLSRVLSVKRSEPRILRPILNTNGYLRVQIHNQAPMELRYVHQIVAEAFHGERPAPDFEVRHLNGDPLDNRAENLCWGSRSDNVRDAVDHGTHNMARRTHCRRGHDLFGPNLYRDHRGRRGCRTCRLARSRAYEIRRNLRAAGVRTERAA